MIAVTHYSTAYAEGKVVRKGDVVKADEDSILIPSPEYNEIVSGCVKCLDDLESTQKELDNRPEVCPPDWGDRFFSGLIGFGAGVTTIAITIFMILVF